MKYLLDANVLIALALDDHVHHDAAHRWRRQSAGDVFASSPVTEGALVRALLRVGYDAGAAHAGLVQLAAEPLHEFWADDLSYVDVDLKRVVGHRQVTDAYLAALARKRGGRLATLDRGLAALHPGVCELIDA